MEFGGSLIDDFNRANESPLSDAGRWSNNITSIETGLQVASNLLASTSSTTATGWRNDASYGPNVEVSVTIATKPGAGNSARLYARLQTPGGASVDGYVVIYSDASGTDQISINRIDAGAITALQTFNQEFAAGDRFEIRLVDTAIQAWRFDGTSWSEVGEVADSTYTGPGYIGVGLRGVTGRLDDFSGVSLSPPPTPDPAPTLDNFDRANESPLSDAGKWGNSVTGVETGLQVVNNRLSANVTNTATAWRKDQRYGPDSEAWVTIATKPGIANSVRLYVRLQTPGGSSSDGYVLLLLHNAGTDQVVIDRLDAGALTSLKTINQEFAAGDEVKLRAIGTTLQAWRYDGTTWSELGETTDATYTGGGYIGVGLRGTTGRLDDFRGDSIPPLPIPDPAPVLDSFNRANENPLSDAGKWGNGITGIESGLAVSSNLILSALSSTATAWRKDQRYGPDTDATVTIQTKPGVGNAVRLYARVQSPGTSSAGGYFLLFAHGAGTDQVLIYRLSAGNTVTVLKTMNQEFASGDELRIRVVGSTIQAWRYNGFTWSELGETVDSTYTGAGYVGVGLRGTSGRLDDFRASNAAWLAPRQTYGECTGAGVHALAPTVCSAGQVNSFTGAFTLSATDLTLPGRGVPFSFERSYTSADTTSGRLGPGWTDSYSASLSVQANGDVILHGEDGQQVYYAKQPNGSFIGVAGARSVLTSVSGGYTLVRSDQVRYQFNSSGVLQSERDRNGQGLSFTHDGAGRLSIITDSVGRSIGLTYDAASGLLTQVALPDGRTVAYAYTNGRLTSVTDPQTGVTSYTYEAHGWLQTGIDQNQHTIVNNTYSSDGRLLTQADGLGKITGHSWNAATQTETSTDPRGKQSTDTYADGMLIKHIDPLGNTTRYSYDVDLNQAGVTDPRGNTTTTTYDSRGNMLTRTAPAPLSYQESWTYNSNNDPLTYTDGRGKTTTYGYDTAGNLTSRTQPGSVVTQYGRDPNGTGLLISTTDPRGKTTTYAYDASGNLASTTTPLGNTTTMGHDAAGRVTSRVDPRGNAAGANPADYTTTSTYNNANQKLTETDANGHTTTWSYDPAGNVVSTTDANTNTTTYSYDANNQLSAVTAPGNTVTAYTYDDAGNLISRTDQNNHTTHYTYDDANQLATIADPLTRTWAYNRDANGNTTTTTFPGGPTATNSYDALDRLTSITYSDSTTPAVAFSYDSNGNRTQMIDGAGTVNYSYDDLNRLTTTTRGTNIFSYGYDAADNVTSRTYPGGVTTAYTYDDDERLASVTNNGATTSYTYDPAAQLTQTNRPSSNGWNETRSYDHAGQLTQIKDANGTATLQQLDYSYDPIGDATSLTRLNHSEQYQYDNRGRLTKVCYDASCAGATDYTSWTYDGVGNRLTETRTGGNTTYTYDAADQLTQATSSASSTSYTYDSNGNQTSAGGRTYSYDLANRIIATTSSGATTTYSYDGDGNRLTAASAAATTNYLWDTNNELAQLVVERDGTGNALRTYIQGVRTISMLENGAAYYYHYELLGSIAAITSDLGATEWEYSYEPFGSARTADKIDLAAPDNLLGYVGQYSDPTTSLLDLRARQYDPATGRFNELDPKPAGPITPYEASYSYAGQDPINSYDLDGLSCKWAGRIPIMGGWAKRRCHALASPVVGLRDEAKAQAGAAMGTMANESMGGGKVRAQGPISGPASSPMPRRGMACVALLTGLAMAFTAAPIEAFEAKEALAARAGFSRAIVGRGGVRGIGQWFAGASLGLMGGGQLAGGCARR